MPIDLISGQVDGPTLRFKEPEDLLRWANMQSPGHNKPPQLSTLVQLHVSDLVLMYRSILQLMLRHCQVAWRLKAIGMCLQPL